MLRAYAVGRGRLPVQADRARGAAVEGSGVCRFLARASCRGRPQLRDNEHRETERLAEGAAAPRRSACNSRCGLRGRSSRSSSRGAPSLRGFDLGGMSHPAEVDGGDYFDYIPLAGGGMAVAVGDVCGHGLGPALLMAATRAIAALALTNSQVGDILGLANQALAADVDEGRFVTLFLAALTRGSRLLFLLQHRAHQGLCPGARRQGAVGD